MEHGKEICFSDNMPLYSFAESDCRIEMITCHVFFLRQIELILVHLLQNWFHFKQLIELSEPDIYRDWSYLEFSLLIYSKWNDCMSC